MRQQLVELAMRGDEEAFSSLAAESVDRCYALAFRILRDSHRAQDATQQALLGAWRDLPTLTDASRFDAWLYKLTVNACYIEARSHRRWTARVRVIASNRADAEPDVARSVAARDELEAAFRTLSPERRAIVVLHHHLGFSLVEIAETALAVLPPRLSSPGTVPSATPTEVAPPSPTAAPTIASVEAFRAARNAICHSAALALNPLKLRFLGAFDGTLSDAQVNDWAAALDQFSAGYDQLFAQLSALQPPPELALDHGLNVLDIEEQNVLIRRVALELRHGEWTGASTDDAATNPIGARTTTFERANTLEPCP